MPIESMKVDYYAGTHIGKSRDTNEDCHFTSGPGDLTACGYLFAVADGMGGHSAGEVAAEMAIQGVSECHAGLSEISLGGEAQYLETTLRSISEKIYRTGHHRLEYSGMGTTCIVLLLRGERVIVAHVGDSRCYRIRDSQLTRMTKDRS